MTGPPIIKAPDGSITERVVPDGVFIQTAVDGEIPAIAFITLADQEGGAGIRNRVGIRSETDQVAVVIQIELAAAASDHNMVPNAWRDYLRAGGDDPAGQRVKVPALAGQLCHGPARAGATSELLQQRLFAGRVVEVYPDLQGEVAATKVEAIITDIDGPDGILAAVVVQVERLPEQTRSKAYAADQIEMTASPGQIVAICIERPITEQAVREAQEVAVFETFQGQVSKGTVHSKISV